MRWDPNSAWFMLNKYYGTAGSVRKTMLVGPRFNPSYLEVHNANPIGNGFQGIHADYHDFLTPLAKWDWKPLDKLFDFPVYAVGYNWTDSNENSGKMLADRIKAIKAEAAKVTGQCEKVIVLTHSMGGGLVARWASQQEGAKDSILGIVHCVQPVTGATAAYWRMKAGFEGGMAASGVLGDSAHTVTPILGNIPGGLQLLPNKLHVANDNSKAWLRVTGKIATPFSLPNSDPYDEIYRVQVSVTTTNPDAPTVSQWWGLVDPGLLDPRPNPDSKGFDLPEDSNDAVNASRQTSAWTEYLRVLKIAEDFHDTLGKDAHPVTFCIRGTGKPTGTCDVVRFVVESNWIRR